MEVLVLARSLPTIGSARTFLIRLTRFDLNSYSSRRSFLNSTVHGPS